MLLINGKIKHRIDITDRGFQYGDGLFETIEIINGQPVFFQRHLTRLKAGCRQLSIPCPDIRLLSDETSQLIKNSSRAVLKLIITRGIGGRGYRQPEMIEPTRVLSLHDFPDYPVAFMATGIKARFCHYRLGHNPGLAGIKHLNRLEQVLARAEWSASEIQEGLMLDIDEHVVEGTMSNLFCVKDNILYTPKLDLNGVDGIIRSVILNEAAKQDIKIIITRLGKPDIVSADELFVSNSIIGIWPIRQLEQHIFSIGAVTKKIITLLEQCKQKDLESCFIK